jgi:tetratricopeptide (TPR) repeat protein
LSDDPSLLNAGRTSCPQPAKDAATVLQSISAAEAEGRIADAIAGSETLVRLSPGQREAWMRLGDLQMSVGRVTEAAVAFNQATQLAPPHPRPLLRLAAAQSAMGMEHQALANARAIGVDVGGRGWLDQVDGWLRSTAWRAWAMRGDPRPERGDGSGLTRVPGWLETFRRDDGRRLMLADPACKARIIDGLAAPPDSPVACLLPRDVAADDHLLRHLASEERGEPDAKGASIWIKRGKNDLLDGGTYAVSLAHLASLTALRRQAAPSQPIQIGA